LAALDARLARSIQCQLMNDLYMDQQETTRMAAPTMQGVQQGGPKSKKSKKTKQLAILEAALHGIHDGFIYNPEEHEVNLSCSEVRRKITEYLELGEISQTSFLKKLGVNNNSFHRFMRYRGEYQGKGNALFIAAFHFFNKREMRKAEQARKGIIAPPVQRVLKKAPPRSKKKIKEKEFLDDIAKVQPQPLPMTLPVPLPLPFPLPLAFTVPLPLPLRQHQYQRETECSP